VERILQKGYEKNTARATALSDVAWCLGNGRNVEATKDWAANVS